MPQITRYTPQVQLTQYLQGRASPVSFGALEGQALQGLGEAAQGLSQRLEEIQVRKDELQYNNVLTDFRIESMKRAEDINRTSGGNLLEAQNADLKTRADALQIPESMKERFQQDLNQMRVTMAGAAIQEQTRRAGAAARQNFEDIVTKNENLVALDPAMQQTAMDTLAASVNALPLDPTTKQSVLNQSRDRIRSKAAEVLARTRPDEFKQSAEAGQWNDVKDIDSYLRLADATKKTQEAEQKRLIDQGAQVTESELSLSLELAETPQDIVALQNQIINSQTLDPVKKNKMLERTVTKQRKFDIEQEQIEKGYAFSSGQAVLNPADTEDKKAFDAYYDKVIEPALANQPPEKRGAFLADLIDNSKVIPTRLQGNISVAARSQNPQEISLAADFIDRVRFNNPHMLGDFNSRDIARIDLVRQYQESGYSDREAVDRADKDLVPVSETLRKERDGQLKEAKINYRENAVGVFNRWYTPNIDNSEVSAASINSMERDYRRAYDSQYQVTGNADQAAKHAETVVRGLYDVTKVNGMKQVMMHAPDKYYGIQGDSTDWIREQYLEQINEVAKDSMFPPEMDIEKDFFLAADPFITPRTAKQGEPVYKIMYRTPEGTMLDILGNGKYWKPDRNKRQQQLIEKAKNGGFFGGDE